MSIEVLVPDISYDTNIQVLAFGTKLEINSQKKLFCTGAPHSYDSFPRCAFSGSFNPISTSLTTCWCAFS